MTPSSKSPSYDLSVRYLQSVSDEQLPVVVKNITSFKSQKSEERLVRRISLP